MYFLWLAFFAWHNTVQVHPCHCKWWDSHLQREHPERSGRGASDSTCVSWLYYSATDPIKDMYNGLVVPLVIWRKGSWSPMDYEITKNMPCFSWFLMRTSLGIWMRTWQSTGSRSQTVLTYRMKLSGRVIKCRPLTENSIPTSVWPCMNDNAWLGTC